MRKTMMARAMLAVAAAGGLALAQTPAQAAEGGVKVGTLTCNVAAGWGMVIASKRRLSCLFTPSHYRAERYVGQITKIGVDIGYRRSGTIVWAVFAPTERLGRGDLRGSYGGVTASATIGVGIGGNALIGGSNHTVALQPVSIEGSTGVNIAAGIGGIDLRYAPNGPVCWREHRHHRRCR
jgi:hypothetical protein